MRKLVKILALEFVTAVLVAVFLLFIPVAAGAADDESGLWTTMAFAKALNDRLASGVALQLRYDDDISQLERIVLRPSLSYKLDHGQLLTLGYDAHFLEVGEDRVEQRLWQQYQISETFSWFTGTFRVRLEERFIDHVDGVAARGRFLLKASIPLGTLPYTFILSNEVHVGLNELSSGPDDGLDQNRLFAGFSRALGEHVTGTLGYQNQYLDRARDRSIHQIFASVSFKLP